MTRWAEAQLGQDGRESADAVMETTESCCCREWILESVRCVPGAAGTDFTESDRMNEPEESKRETRFPSTRQGLEYRDLSGSSTAENHWLGYRTEKR